MNQNGKRPVLVFDFGGVLFDWNPHYLYDRFFNGDTQAVDQFLEEIEFTEWNAQQDLGRPFAVAVADHCSRFPHHTTLIKAYDENWEEFMGGTIQPSVDLLCRLKQAGYPLYGLSNWSEEKFKLIRRQFTFLDWFDDILISGEVNLIKPDPKIFKVFLDRIQRTSNECLLVDDSPGNIASAEQLGFKTILFKSSSQLEHELKLHGALV
jgi:2-haloacid dehalogenase